MPDTERTSAPKETTRDRLIRVSTELFLRNGFDATTVEEIAASAGVTARTFFRYFPTKENVVFHDRAKRLALFRSALLTPAPGVTPLETLKSAAALVADYYDMHRESLAAEYAIVSGSPLLVAENHAGYRRMEAAMIKCLRQFNGRPYLSARDAALVAAGFLGAHRAMIWEWVARGCCTCMRRRAVEAQNFVDVLSDAIGFTNHGARVMPNGRPPAGHQAVDAARPPVADGSTRHPAAEDI